MGRTRTLPTYSSRCRDVPAAKALRHQHLDALADDLVVGVPE